MLLFFCRSRLAAASVHLPSSVSLHQEVRKDVIQLLCSIFLANLGESEGAGEDKQLQLVGSMLIFFLGILATFILFICSFIPYLLMCLWEAWNSMKYQNCSFGGTWEITDFIFLSGKSIANLSNLFTISCIMVQHYEVIKSCFCLLKLKQLQKKKSS